AVSPLLQAMRKDPSRRVLAETLGSLGAEVRPAFPRLRRCFVSEDPKLATAAFIVYGALGKEAEPEFDVLVDALERTEPEVRSVGLYALATLRPSLPQRNDEIISAILKAGDHEDEGVVSTALSVVGSLESPHRTRGVPWAVELLKSSKSVSVQSAALTLLYSCGLRSDELAGHVLEYIERGPPKNLQKFAVRVHERLTPKD
ncbi:MAG: HEAT repeat domain-containing protein, partial [Planctomycetota bacterium]